MGVGAEHAGHIGTDEVLADVDLDDGVHIGVEALLDDGFGDEGLGDDGFAPPLDHVDGGGLLVGAHVT